MWVLLETWDCLWTELLWSLTALDKDQLQRRGKQCTELKVHAEQLPEPEKQHSVCDGEWFIKVRPE